jgi:hypothetical protein
MSRPQKIHKPLKGGFNTILGAVAMGSGVGKRTAKKLADPKTRAAQNADSGAKK